jgi:hypothetical protein
MSSVTCTEIHCDQCQAAMINGVFCHERGCPNQGKVYEDGEWVQYHECINCGYDVRLGENCDCQDVDDDPDTDEPGRCPDCERPNQFGELCLSCREDRS